MDSMHLHLWYVMLLLHVDGVSCSTAEAPAGAAAEALAGTAEAPGAGASQALAGTAEPPAGAAAEALAGTAEAPAGAAAVLVPGISLHCGLESASSIKDLSLGVLTEGPTLPNINIAFIKFSQSSGLSCRFLIRSSLLCLALQFIVAPPCSP
jgi:hypothetical protein